MDLAERDSYYNERESTLYVDFVHTDEGHTWVQPLQYHPLLGVGFPYIAPRVLRLIRDLHALGFADPRALEVIAKTWRPVRMNPDFHRRDLRDLNRQTLEALQAKGLLRNAAARTHGTVIDRWLFPLHSVDLSPIPVDKDRLRAARDDYWYREMGVYVRRTHYAALTSPVKGTTKSFESPRGTT